jgi:predicted enzyme related to lactoylglutathione lyase
MARVVHFEINADNPERASKFYGTVFGWNIQKWDGPQQYWLASTGDKSEMGIDGAIMPRQHPQATTVNTIGVGSLDESLKKITENGGKIVMERQTIPGVGYFAYCQDTEGNTFGVMQPDMNAK